MRVSRALIYIITIHTDCALQYRNDSVMLLQYCLYKMANLFYISHILMILNMFGACPASRLLHATASTSLQYRLPFDWDYRDGTATIHIMAGTAYRYGFRG